jgi:putative colanic acid biosynthesis acetyltransferase WcaF
METTSLKIQFDKKSFKIGASNFKVYSWYFMSTLFFKSGFIPFSFMLVYILKIFGAKIGKDVRIKPGIHIRYPWKLTVGNHSWLADCYIENLDTVIIGRHACVSQQAMLMTGNHNYKSIGFDLITKPIIIEDGVWVGAQCLVLPGVEARSHSVLTAGSTAVKNLDAYTIYQGNPAVKIRERIIMMSNILN